MHPLHYAILIFISLGVCSITKGLLGRSFLFATNGLAGARFPTSINHEDRTFEENAHQVGCLTDPSTPVPGICAYQAAI
jgi:hypothetical protein